MSYWNKDKKTTSLVKKRTSWSQTSRSSSFSKGKTFKKIKKSLQYLLVLRKFNNIIDYKNIRLLKAFLNKYGKIKPRRKTRIPTQRHHSIARAIRKSRALGLIPFTCDIKL